MHTSPRVYCYTTPVSRSSLNLHSRLSIYVYENASHVAGPFKWSAAKKKREFYLFLISTAPGFSRYTYMYIRFP